MHAKFLALASATVLASWHSPASRYGTGPRRVSTQLLSASNPAMHDRGYSSISVVTTTVTVAKA